jgi:cell surface protein SprA
MFFAGTRSTQCAWWTLSSLSILAFIILLTTSSTAYADIGVGVEGKMAGYFDPEADLRAPKPFSFFGSDSLALLDHESMLFRMETEYDTTNGYYLAKRTLFGDEYGIVRVFTIEDYRRYRINRAQKELIQKKFRDAIIQPKIDTGSGAIEIQVPFKIRSKTFRRIFGGDRVGLRVSGNITIDGGFKREKSDQGNVNRVDNTNNNFKIDQTQQFKIEGKVGDKVSVLINQDSQSTFDFENNVKLEYQGTEDEIIQSIEAGNVSLQLPGTRLATVSAGNKGLFGFKVTSRIGPLSITTISSLQKGEKKKIEWNGGSEAKQPHDIKDTENQLYQYFFLDSTFKDNYFHYSEDMSTPSFISQDRIITKVEIYKSTTVGVRSTQKVGIAIANLENSWSSIADIDSTYQDSSRKENQDDQFIQSAQFVKLVEGADYTISKAQGWFRLRSRAMEGEVIAVAVDFQDEDMAWGTPYPPSDKVILRMIKSASPIPGSPTWDLTWKHVYWVGTTELKEGDFEFKITRTNETTEAYQDGTWLDFFGLDQRDATGAEVPDGIIDPAFIDIGLGEIHFPDPRPFDSDSGYYRFGNADAIRNRFTGDDEDLNNPTIYNQKRDTDKDKKFLLRTMYSNSSSDIQLGFNILEGSEEVILNGSRLENGVDYTVDYLSGKMIIMNESAFDPSAKLEITYESGSIFQLDKKTMFGIRLEYALWDDSFIGGTFLYFNEKPIDKRVKVGNEPLRNLIWDINAKLKFEPYFMTAMVDALPFIETDEKSSFSFEGEIAQVFPNPNSMNNGATGDNDGVAYIDDFEATKRTTPLGIQRKIWHKASHPYWIPDGITPFNDIKTEDDYRGNLVYFNPVQQTKIKEIWPTKEVNSKVPETVHILTVRYNPRVNNFRKELPNNSIVWNGIVRPLSAGLKDQTTSKFLEVWIKLPTGTGGTNPSLYFDLGEIDEDYIPDGELNTEDKEKDSITNDILDVDEDYGIDNMSFVGEKDGDDPPLDHITSDFTTDTEDYDWWDLDGQGDHDQDEPYSCDDWKYDPGSDGYDKINGLQGNGNDGEFRYPDTEDINGNSVFDRNNNFFRYRYRFGSDIDSMKYVRGGQDNEKDWRLLRIPLEDVFETIGTPSMQSIKAVRIFMTGLDSPVEFSFAQIELVGNEWLEDPVYDPIADDTLIYVSGSTINSVDNAEYYTAPPGVAGTIDPITNLRSKEQSLVLRIFDLPTAAEGQLIKELYDDQDLGEYRTLKMFVNGYNLQECDLEMFLRFGDGLSGSDKAYYEYSQKVNPGWSGNEIIINLDRLAALKKKARENGETTAFEQLANGDIIKIFGNPKLGSIDYYSIGVRNMGRPIRREEEIEVWADEMRLSGIRKEIGMAMRSGFDANFASFFTIKGNVEQNDAAFHQVDSRTGSNSSKINGNLDVSLDIDQFFNPDAGLNLGLSASTSSKLEIPKYTEPSGDIRTTAIVDNKDDLSVWRQFSRIGLSKDHFQDKLLYDANGNPIIDDVTGAPKQDLDLWGIDTLFATNQSFSWRFNYKKKSKADKPNWFIKNTFDNIAFGYTNSQTYSSTLENQYNKSFKQSGNAKYSLAFEKPEVPIFRWAENIPVLKKLANSTFSYLPTNIDVGVDVNEQKNYSKIRNQLEKQTPSMTMKRNFSTGYSPFSGMSFSYSWNANSQFVKEDSTRQGYLYNANPDTMKFKPGTTSITIFDETVEFLRALVVTTGSEAAEQIANNAEARRDVDEMPYDENVRILFEEIDNNDAFNPEILKHPWDHVSKEEQAYIDTFSEYFGLPFIETTNGQTVSFNYSPNIASWLSSSVNYSSNYNWEWGGNFSSTQRRVSTNNNFGGTFTLKLRQLLPASRSNSSSNSNRPTNRSIPGADGFGEGGDVSDSEESRPKINLPNINPLKIITGSLRKLKDIKINYTQSYGYGNPSIEAGEPDFMYKIGLSGDPGLDVVENIGNSTTSNITDDYSITTGIDFTSKLVSTINYKYQVANNSTTALVSTVKGRVRKSGFSYYEKDSRSIKALTVPNYSIRWSGIERIGKISNFADRVELKHSFQGDLSEDWTEDGNVGRQSGKNTFKRSFDPIAGITISWKYGISTSFDMNSSIDLTDDGEGTLTRQTNGGYKVSSSYTRKSGFRIPLPIWPFKNRRFNNETTFSVMFSMTNSKAETRKLDGEFQETGRNGDWSINPTINYKFSKTVSGSMRYKYGMTDSSSKSSSIQEFGVNVKIAIRG